VRFASSAVPLKAALERFLPRLRQCAAKIASQYTELSSEHLSGGVASTP
jgi:hypothetical protein